jgi:HlyD family secretion protein
VEEQRVNVLGDFVDSPARLGDRYRVEVRVVVWQTPRVLRVPVSALVRHGGGWAVYVVTGGRAHLALVEVGHRSSSDAEVLTGLAEGVMVVLHPSDRVADGVRVRSAIGG